MFQWPHPSLFSSQIHFILSVSSVTDRQILSSPKEVPHALSRQRDRQKLGGMPVASPSVSSPIHNLACPVADYLHGKPVGLGCAGEPLAVTAAACFLTLSEHGQGNTLVWASSPEFLFRGGEGGSWNLSCVCINKDHGPSWGDVIRTSRGKGLPQINKQFFFCFYEHFLRFCWDLLFFLSIISLFLPFSSFSPLFHIPPCLFPLLHFFHSPSFPPSISSFHTSFLFLYIRFLFPASR